MSALKTAARANISLASLGEMKGWIEDNNKLGLGLGNVTDLSRNYASCVRISHIKDIREILKHSYGEYAIIFDGTPSFAEAECVMVRFVTHDLQIVDLVVRVALFDKKLNSEMLAHHIIESLTGVIGLDLKNWGATMQDCARKKLKVAAPFAELYRKLWQKVVQYPGKARDYTADLFEETVSLSSGVRFLVQAEQTAQISKQGIRTKINDDILPKCIDNAWSLASAEIIHEEFALIERKGELGMAILEKAAVTDVGMSYCKAAYSAEGDSPLILTGDSIFVKIERELEHGFGTSNIERVVDEALALILEAKANATRSKDDASLQLTAAQEEYNTAKEQLKTLNETKTSLLTNRTGRSGRISILTARTVDEDAVETVILQISETKALVKEAKKRRDDINKSAEKYQKTFDDWSATFPHQTRNALIEHGKSIAAPLNKYYTDLFLKEDGDCYNTRQAVLACKIFDPLFLKGKQNDLPRLYALADKLKYFGYSQFTQDFIECLKKEVSQAIEDANEHFDWDAIKETKSKQFQTRIQRRIKRYKLLHDNDQFDWRQDPGERACNIWEWWRARLLDSSKFSSFKKALRLVVLAQLSSCAVERVFSRLKMIKDICGDNSLEDMTEIRIFMQCNGDFDELLMGIPLIKFSD